MNMESFEEERILSKSIDKVKFIKEEMMVQVLKWNGKAIDVQLPKTVIYKVIEAAPGAKGNTAQGRTEKPAIIETGAEIMVRAERRHADAVGRRVSRRVGPARARTSPRAAPPTTSRTARQPPRRPRRRPRPRCRCSSRRARRSRSTPTTASTRAATRTAPGSRERRPRRCTVAVRRCGRDRACGVWSLLKVRSRSRVLSSFRVCPTR